MPTGRILKYCLALSVLFHAAIVALSTLLPVAPRRAEDVMVVDLADLPRSTDFLPPKPGIVRGARPADPPKPARPLKPQPRPELLRGAVPDLPVDPGLPPEKEFPAAPAREEPQPRPKEPPAQAARAPDRAPQEKPAPPSRD